jgi:hypothetical protein
MSAVREFSSDDFIVIKADIDDSPSVEIPLIELFDLATFTLVDNYQHVLHGYVIELLENTVWMDEQLFLCLLRAGYDICREMEIGGVLPMKKRDLQSFILKTLCDCDDNDCYCAVPLIIKFSVPIAVIPRYQRRPTVSRQIIQNSSASRLVAILSSDDKSSVLISVPFAVKDTNGGILTIISETMRDSVKSTYNNVQRMSFIVSAAGAGSSNGTLSGNDNESMSNDDTNDGDSIDVRIIVEKDLLGHSFAATTVVNARGTSVEGNITYCHTNKQSEDVEMQPEKETEQHRVAQLLHNWPSTFAGPHRLSLPSELMRYHPIDRGRCRLIAN